jgi:hypothetical protein
VRKSRRKSGDNKLSPEKRTGMDGKTYNKAKPRPETKASPDAVANAKARLRKARTKALDKLDEWIAVHRKRLPDDVLEPVNTARGRLWDHITESDKAPAMATLQCIENEVQPRGQQ